MRRTGMAVVGTPAADGTTTQAPTHLHPERDLFADHHRPPQGFSVLSEDGLVTLAVPPEAVDENPSRRRSSWSCW